MEMLTHVNKRVRDNQAIQLPLVRLMDLYCSSGNLPLVRNFALVYMEMAYQRAPEDIRLSVVRLA